MNTLQASLGLAPPLQITRASPWTNSFTTHPSTATQNSSRPSSSKTSWVLQAEAKGFGGSRQEPLSITEKQRKKEEKLDTKRNGNKNEDDDDKIEQVVWDRMIVRILFSVGTPMATGVALLCILSVLKGNGIWDVPAWIPFLTILLCFGTSAIGIAYGTLSTSMDPSSKGTLLGWEQVEQNWPELWKEENESK